MKATFSFRDTFQSGSSYRAFLLCILITGLSGGLYKGILDNYLAEIINMSEMDRGIRVSWASQQRLRRHDPNGPRIKYLRHKESTECTSAFRRFFRKGKHQYKECR